MTISIAILGVSHWHAAIYLEGLMKLGARVAGSSDADPQAGRIAAERFGFAFDPDPHAMLARARPDFAFVLPRPDRVLQELAPVLDRGVPFLIEKPMGLDGIGAREIARRVNQSGLWAVPALPNRLLEIWDHAAKLAASGKLGTVMHASFRLINGPPERYRSLHAVPWMLDPARSGGGALRNLGVHGADAALRLAGTTTLDVVAARLTQHGYREPVEEYANAMLVSADRTLFQIEAGYSFAPASGGDFEWRIAATGAYLVQTKGALIIRHADGRTEKFDTVQPSYVPFTRRALADFRRGVPPCVTLDDCAAAVELCDRIYAAAPR